MATAAAPARKWAREYETIYILRPDVDTDAQEKVVERAKDVISRLDGTLTKLDNWGKRKLAYPIRKSNRGVFVYLKYIGFSDLVAELERNLRLIDEVVRFQTVLLQEDIDPASVSVDPDEVQYLHVEDDEEAEDVELERARSLGMAPRAPREEESSPESAESTPPQEAAKASAETPSDAEAPAEGDSPAQSQASAEAAPASADAGDAVEATEAAAEPAADAEGDKKEEG